MTTRPINGHVLVKTLEADKQTAGGIYLPDNAKEKLHEGEVVALAEDATEEVAIGDRVIYKEFSGTEIKLDSEDYILLSSEDLLAKYFAADGIPE
ncbi:MAG: co-chaperone GroES [Planctomycetes bacterium]|nr:co-chaperone GroES [Planctomycetota bacterium]